jgi:2-polyprenyl-3-methyl-5-hydroxy-6-metoxy-1,4-benzoquinol methylase
MSMSERSMWNHWNESGGPKYPHEKVVQFCFRNYPPEIRKGIRALDLGCGSGVHTIFLVEEGFDVTGINLSEIAIKNTRKKLNLLGLKAD